VVRTTGGFDRQVYDDFVSATAATIRPLDWQGTQCGSYDYSVTLPAPFFTSAGTRYWLLIQAETPLNSMSGWSWRKGQGNGFSLSNIAGSTFPWDFAFAVRR
jgi:hypothetical protein